jgi:erythromycin esterase-like protein
MNRLLEILRAAAVPIYGAWRDADPILDAVGDAEIVLLGEATHGTHEFYRERAQITKKLIEERGFNAVAIEGDWPDAYRVNRYVRGQSEDADAEEALRGFRRFPGWMWRNADVLDFVGWLRSHNDALPKSAEKAGFYGLDLYSLHASVEAVISYLERTDPPSAKRARRRYSCLDHSGGDKEYGLGVHLSSRRSCEDEVVNELTELRLREAQYMQRDGRAAGDEFFCAEQNALVIKNAEEYYRTMFQGEVSSWNLRDSHMVETLSALRSHMSEQGVLPKTVVWAHNSHVGDARVTRMGHIGEINLGQLCRERWGKKVYTIGFTTYSGTVTAASEWDGPAERKQVRPAIDESYESLFHGVGYSRFYLNLREEKEAAFHLGSPRLERAIGVVYRPETELRSHYFECALPGQFDSVLHFDETRAVEPLERTSLWEAGEVPETYPTGI